jgi:uncharacterized protein GlcG (DUF336 family)
MERRQVKRRAELKDGSGPGHAIGRWVATTALCALAASCGGGSESLPPPSSQPADTAPVLEPDEIRAIMELAARATPEDVAIAVTDRQARILGVSTNFPIDPDTCKTPTCIPGNEGCEAACGTASPDCQTVSLATQLARTAGLFSADQIFLTSRAVRFISDPNFPPGIANTGAGGLFSIEATNRGCQLDAANPDSADFNPGKFYPPQLNVASLLREQDGEAPLLCRNEGEGASFWPNRCGCNTGIATLPGGVPVFKNGRLVGGIGVALRGVSQSSLPADPVANADNPDGLRRDAAFAQAQLDTGELAARAFAGDDIAVQNVRRVGFQNVCEQTTVTRPACCFADPPCFLSVLPVPPPAPFPAVVFLEGLALPFVEFDPPVPANPGTYPGIDTVLVEPRRGNVAPDGWIVGPKPATDGATVANPLTEAEVRQIVEQAVAAAEDTRSAVRLPGGGPVNVVHAVTDTRGELIGLFRQPDALPDAIDVCPAKARTSAYLSSTDVNPLDTRDEPSIGVDLGLAFPPGTAITGRALGFGGQPFFPSGINSAPLGPFRVLFNQDQAMPCTLARQPDNGRENGAIFFPGGVPVYKNGVLVGGFGVSGDGGEQNDLIASYGVTGFEAATEIRADQIVLRKNEGDGVRLPYLKFNRRPSQP